MNRITKLETFNWRGLPARQSFDIPELTCILQENGVGKTSFISALLYVLTGREPESRMVHADGGAKCSVMITFEDGNSFARSKNGTKGTHHVNKKRVTRKEFEDALSNELGIPMDAIRIATSSDVVRSMKPQELSDFLLPYISESLTKEALFALFEDGTLTKDMRQIITQMLPMDEFGLEKIDEVYKKSYDYRTVTKKNWSDAKAKLEVYRAQEAGYTEGQSKEELLTEKKRCEDTIAELAAYKAKAEAKEKLLKEREKQQKMIRDLEEQAESIKAKKRDLEERNELSRKIAEKSRDIDASVKAIATMEQMALALKTSLETLDKPVCPLSDKLTCTTDKSAIREDLHAELKKSEDSIRTQKEYSEKLKEELEALRKEAEAFDKEQLEWSRKATLTAQKDRLLSMMKTAEEDAKELVPPAVTGDAKAELEAINKKLQALAAHDMVIATSTEMAKYQRQLNALEGLVAAFAPKGIVKTSLIASYMSSFEELANETAEELRPGMRFRFVSDNGVHVLCDLMATGTYLEYSALSEGEKALMLFVMLDLLNKLTGLGIMIMDELSVLDADAFGRILRSTKLVKSRYRNIIVAAVNHDDTVEKAKEEHTDVYHINKEDRRNEQKDNHRRTA